MESNVDQHGEACDRQAAWNGRLLMGQIKLERTVLCLGIEVEDALKLSEQAEISNAYDQHRKSN